MREAETGGSRMDRNDSKQEDVRVCTGTSKTKGGITASELSDSLEAEDAPRGDS